MPLLDLQGVADQAIRRGLDALNTFGEEGFYRPYRDAGIVGVAGAALGRPNIGGVADLSAWQMVSAGTPEIMSSEGLPPRWVAGQLGLRILYTGAASSTANIALRYNLDPILAGQSIAAVTSVDFTTPGPATAGHPLTVDVPTMVAIDASALCAGWKISRLNVDAYGANDVWIIGVRPLWYPGRG